MIFDPNKVEYVNNIDLSFNEPLLEATIAIDYRNSISINVFPRDTFAIGYFNDPYFKVYNHSNMKAAKNVARISMLAPKYIHHRDPNGKNDFRLSSHQKSIIINMLKSPSYINNKHYNTAWEGICIYLNDIINENHIISAIDYKELVYKMPNYMKL